MRIVSILKQIVEAVKELKDWNKDISDADDYYSSGDGMKNLAASCMLIEVIGEGFKQIDKLSYSQLLPLRPEIPWQDVIGIRNHIAHGYFDIDGELVLSTVKNDLDDLAKAANYFIEKLEL